MCGRYAATKNPARLMAEFEAFDGTEGHAPAVDHNKAPTKKALTVVQRHPRDAEGAVLAAEPSVRSLRVMRWGLVPFWAKDSSGGARMINTRAETAAEKPSFRTALARRRCLVPIDGWFEWRREGSGKSAVKEPFYITGPDEGSLALAGIWESWRDPKAGAEAEPLITFSILTTDAVGRVQEVHHRMPLVLPAGNWAGWLDPDREDVGELLAPPGAELVDTLELRRVSDRVNNARNNGPELLEPATEAVDLDGAGEADEPALFDVPRT